MIDGITELIIFVSMLINVYGDNRTRPDSRLTFSPLSYNYFQLKLIISMNVDDRAN